MGDEDDRGARVAQPSHDGHEVVDLLRRQHRGRLVEDEHGGVAHQRLEDLRPLLDADREILDESVWGHGESVALGDLLDVAPDVTTVEEPQDPTLGLLVPERDVLGDGEDRDQHEVLVHHADPGLDRVARSVEVDRATVDQQLTLVRRVQAVEHVHQRALAGTVLAEERVDLTRLDREVDVVVGHQGPEPLGDPLELQSHE